MFHKNHEVIMKIMKIMKLTNYFMALHYFHELFHIYYQKLHDLTRHEHVHDTKIHEQVLECSVS